MLYVATFRFNNFYENTYLAYDNTRECLLIDPGMYTIEERNCMDSFISFQKLNLRYIALTHAHLDHILGLSYAMHKYKTPLLVHQAEHRNLPLLKNYGSTQGYALDDITDNFSFVQEGDIINVGVQSYDVYHTPGHTPNSISLYNESAGRIFSGDILFSTTIGNTHLPGGNQQQLIHTIETKMLPLSQQTIFFPGHGPSATINYIHQAIQKGYFRGLSLQQAL